MQDRVLPHFPLTKSRTHEVCGSGAVGFAFVAAAQSGGQVMWLREGWRGEQINPIGFSEFIDPADLLLGNAASQTDLLAVAEESLRSGAVALVVMELSKPLGLTAGRRLQLAARDGACTGLAIIAEGAGSNAAETRWHCSPIFDVEDSTLHCWELIKNKSGTLGVWHVRWDAATRRLVMVSPAGK